MTGAAEQDTIRWGDRTDLTWKDNASLLTAASKSTTRQLVNAHWRWPISWQTQFILVPQIAPGTTATFLFAFAVKSGAGSAQVNYHIYETLAPTGAGPYLDLTDTTNILPARDIQISLESIIVLGEGGIAGPCTCEVGVMVAPVTEPHATLLTMELLERLNPQYQPGGQQERWMNGFHPEALYYDPRATR